MQGRGACSEVAGAERERWTVDWASAPTTRWWDKSSKARQQGDARRSGRGRQGKRRRCGGRRAAAQRTGRRRRRGKGRERTKRENHNEKEASLWRNGARLARAGCVWAEALPEVKQLRRLSRAAGPTAEEGGRGGERGRGRAEKNIERGRTTKQKDPFLLRRRSARAAGRARFDARAH